MYLLPVVNGGITFWEVMKDPLLGKTCKAGLHCLANDFLTGWGEWWDLQEVQPWDDINTHQLAVYIQ